MPIDPISDLPIGLFMARSLDPRSTLPLGFLPSESHLRYISRHHHAVNTEDIWELLDGMPQDTPPEPFPHKMGHWG